jgi:hypothetical protein
MKQGIPTAWQYVAETLEPDTVVSRIYPDGTQESCLATREDVVAWVDSGNRILTAE